MNEPICQDCLRPLYGLEAEARPDGRLIHNSCLELRGDEVKALKDEIEQLEEGW